MKILEVSRSYYPSIGGLEKFVKNRIALYEDLGFETELATTDYLLKEPAPMEDGVIRFNQHFKYNFILNRKKLITLKMKQCEIVSVNQIGNFLSDYILSSSFNSKPVKILTPHYYFHTDQYSIAKKYYSRFVAEKILKHVDYMICFTDSEAGFWMHEFNFPQDKIHVIPHYVDYDSEPQGINDEGYILFLGRNAPNKRIDLLLKAWESLKIKSKLIIAGAEGLEAKVNNAESKGIVSESEKRELLKNCSALILAADHEAFASVLMEASAFKKPILCSRLKVFDDVLSEDGYLTFGNNADEISQIVREFETLNTEEKIRMGEINFKNLERYNYLKIKSYYNIFFENIL